MLSSLKAEKDITVQVETDFNTATAVIHQAAYERLCKGYDPGLTWTPEATTKDNLLKRHPDKNSFNVIKAEGLIVGAVITEIADGWCHISKFCLLNSYQKKGIAGKALEYMLKETIAINGLSLEIRDEGQEGLSGFYKRNGFEEVGKRHNMLIFERRKRPPAGKDGCVQQRATKLGGMYEKVLMRGRWA